MLASDDRFKSTELTLKSCKASPWDAEVKLQLPDSVICCRLPRVNFSCRALRGGSTPLTNNAVFMGYLLRITAARRCPQLQGEDSTMNMFAAGLPALLLLAAGAGPDHRRDGQAVGW